MTASYWSLACAEKRRIFPPCAGDDDRGDGEGGEGEEREAPVRERDEDGRAAGEEEDLGAEEDRLRVEGVHGVDIARRPGDEVARVVGVVVAEGKALDRVVELHADVAEDAGAQARPEHFLAQVEDLADEPDDEERGAEDKDGIQGIRRGGSSAPRGEQEIDRAAQDHWPRQLAEESEGE